MMGCGHLLRRRKRRGVRIQPFGVTPWTPWSLTVQARHVEAWFDVSLQAFGGTGQT